MKLFRLLYILILLALCVNETQAQFTGKPQYRISTRRDGVPLGDITVELFPLIAPKHARNFDSLVTKMFYDTTAFHRVIPGFMIQGGDPNSRHGARSTWGFGDPSQPTVPAEFNSISHLRGILSAARSNDPNSATSQFFICVAASTHLDGQYSAYGRAVAGMDIADTIVNTPRDTKDNPLKKIEMFVSYIGSNDSVPDAPQLVSPANKSQNAIANGLALNWTKVNAAIVYRIDVSKDSTFNIINYTTEVSKTTANLGILDGNTRYYWRVRTNNGGKLSQSSNVWSFVSGVGAPNLVSPANNSFDVQPTTTFVWKKVAGATSYRIQISRNVNFTTGSIQYEKAGITDTSHVTNFSFLTGASIKYYWRVRSVKDTSEGAFSAARNFSAKAASGLHETNMPKIDLGQNIPNPVNDFTTIDYILPAAGKVSLKLYTILGKEIAVLVDEYKTKGKFSYTLNASGLSQGIYIYKLQAGEQEQVRKMIVY